MYLGLHATTKSKEHSKNRKDVKEFFFKPRDRHQDKTVNKVRQNKIKWPLDYKLSIDNFSGRNL